MPCFHHCNHHIRLDWINVLIYLVWPIVFFAGWIIVPRLMVLLMSICGLVGLGLLKPDEKIRKRAKLITSTIPIVS